MRTVFHCIAAAVLTALSIGVHAQQQATPNDAQIAAIVVTANQVDIDAGKLGSTSAMNSTMRSSAVSSNRRVGDNQKRTRAATAVMAMQVHDTVVSSGGLCGIVWSRYTSSSTLM